MLLMYFGKIITFENTEYFLPVYGLPVHFISLSIFFLSSQGFSGKYKIFTYPKAAPIFSYRSFMVLAFVFRFTILPKLVCVYRMISRLILFPLEYLVDQELLVKETFLFSSELTWPLGRNQLMALEQVHFRFFVLFFYLSTKAKLF